MSALDLTTPEPQAVVADPPAAAPAIAVRQLNKRYGKVLAVRDLDLDVPVGAIYGLIGPNGAGKTTTLSVISTILEPTSGRVEVLGVDPAVDPTTVRRSLGYMPDGLGVYGNLDVTEYLEFFAAAYKIAPRRWTEVIDGMLELVALQSKRDAAVDSLSRGMKQRLSLARALLHDPAVLILDEPASGLDPRARAELRDLLTYLSGMGKTIVISSHILAELEDVCTHIAVISDGTVRAEGTTDDVIGMMSAGRRIIAKFAGGVTEEFRVDDVDEQEALLRRLVVDEDRRLIEFSRAGGGLEALFLSITSDPGVTGTETGPGDVKTGDAEVGS